LHIYIYNYIFSIVYIIRYQDKEYIRTGLLLKNTPTYFTDLTKIEISSCAEHTTIMDASSDTDEQADLVALRHAMLGRNLVVEGGSWTAEAREPDRGRRLHEQLRLARQFRVTMENAAAKAEQDESPRLELLLQHAETINEMVSLTEAVQGNYLLDDYHEYTRLLQEEEDKRNKDLARNKDIVVRQLLALTGVDQPPPARLPSRQHPEGSSLSNDPANPDFDDFPADSDTSLKRSNSAELAHRKRRNVASRRCHDCKSGTTFFRRCQYWLLTGSKCGKTFCSKCLEVRYGETDHDWSSNSDPRDWHCPSCQGTCLCPECVKERKRALKRSSEFARRSVRTTATSTGEP
jgi:hypothetical protein